MGSDWFAGEPEYWMAKWMKLPDAGGVNAFFRVRRTFRLDGLPADPVNVYVSARLKYRLWINGRYIGEGPARSGVENYSYDSYAVEEALFSEENTVALIVNHYGEAPGAFLFQLGDEPILASDDSWCFERAREFRNEKQLYGFADYSEVWDGSIHPSGWMDSSFDDSHWVQCVYLDGFNTLKSRRKTPAAMPFAKVSPREVPQPDTDDVLPIRIFKTGESPLWQETGENFGEYMAGEIQLPLQHCTVEGEESLLAEEGSFCSLKRPSVTSTVEEFEGLFDPFVILDFGSLMNGYITIEAETEEGQGTTLDIGYSDRLYYGRLVTQPYRGLCSADRIEIGEEPVNWQSFYWRHFRYVQISVRNLKGVLKLKRIMVRKVNYPFGEQSDFHCSHEDLNRLWDMTGRTIRLCTYDNFMDNALREKQPWTGDIAVILVGALAMFGDDPVIRRYISTNLGGQRLNGLFPGHWPETSVKAHSVTEEGNILWFEHPMSLILRAEEYYDHGGNRSFIESFAPRLKSYLETLGRYENPDGLLEEIPGQHWVDWAALNMSGISLITNLWYSQILIFVSRLSKTDRSYARSCMEKAKEIRVYLREHLWDRERNLFRDSARQSGKSTYSEHGNYSALYYGIVPEGSMDAFLSSLDGNDVIKVEPSFMYTPVLALMKEGYHHKAMKLISERYRIWFKRGYETLPEEWHPNATFREGAWKGRIRALAQAASCGLPFVFHRGLLGVNPLLPGYKSFVVKPALSLLDFCRGTVPSEFGPVEVQWSRSDSSSRIELSINCPEGISGQLIIPDEFRFYPEGRSGIEHDLQRGLNQFLLASR